MTHAPDEEITAKLIDNLDLIEVYFNDMYSGNMVLNSEIMKALRPFPSIMLAYCRGVGDYTKSATSCPPSQTTITIATISSGIPKNSRFTCIFTECPRHTKPLSDHRRCKEHIELCKFNPEVIEKNTRADRAKTEASKCKFCGNFYGTPTTCQNHMRICSKNPESNLALKSTCKFCKTILWDLSENVMLNHLSLCQSNPDSTYVTLSTLPTSHVLRDERIELYTVSNTRKIDDPLFTL